MPAFRLFLLLLWAAVAAVTLWAIVRLGLPAAAETFASDLTHPWRAQFYADLEAHLLVFACWIAWRERGAGRVAAFVLLTILLGALFTLPYILIESVRARGDARALLLGRRAEPGA